MPDRLFCYGTLCIAEIMRRVSNGVTASTPATLRNFACHSLVGLDYPAITPRRGARVSGVLYQGLSRAQLARLDNYEGAQYRRVRVWVNDSQGHSLQTWTYVLQPRYYHRLSQAGWSLERFRRERLARYLHRSHNKLVGLHGRESTQSA